MSPLRSTFGAASYRGYFPGAAAALANFNGFGTKYANPATLPTTASGLLDPDLTSVTFNSINATIAVAHNTTPFISTYPST